MAATDQTYRKLKTVHVVFGASCVLMLFSVIWMFVQDYNKEFKPIQRKFRDVEAGQSLRSMLQQLPRGEDLQEKINAAEAARKEYAAAQEQMRNDEKKYAAARDEKDTKYRTIKASYDSISSHYDEAVEDAGKETDSSRKEQRAKVVEQKRAELDKLRTELAEAKNELDEANLKFKTEVTEKLAKKREAMESAEDELKRVTGAFDRFAKVAAQKGWKVGDTIRELPIIDGFASPTKIDQIVLNDLTIDYGGFRNVPRYDRCTTCHLGIDRAWFDKPSLTALTQPQPELEKSLRLAKKLLIERQKKGEDLGFDPSDLPSNVELVPLTSSEITQYAAHPRLDLFVDSNSPHAAAKFGCTICHQGQGSSTSFTLASHTPADARQTEEWKKNHSWESIHDWDFPMHSSRFIESSCLQCHHQVTDLVRYGSKEEAPKLLKGFDLVKENGCFGCHEISGIKGGRPVGPDMRLEATPSLELLSAADQEKAKADALNPPGNMRKVGPSLRRLSEKTNEEWARKWIQSPRDFREDTKMPHFYGLSTNSRDVLPDDQKKFPDAEIHSITHYLFAESKDYLKSGDTYRKSLLATMASLYDLTNPSSNLALVSMKDKDQGEYATLEAQRKAKRLVEKKSVERWAALDRKVRGGPLAEKERKELAETTRNFANLALLSVPSQSIEINSVFAELKQHQERLQELKGEEDNVRRLAPPGVLAADTAKAYQSGSMTWVFMLKTGALDADTTKAMQAEFEAVKSAMAKLVNLAKPIPVMEQVFDYNGVVVDKDVIAKGDKDRGQKLFTEKGCLACHSHAGTEPGVVSEAQFGPNLSRVAAKLVPDSGGEEAKRRWLVQWVLNPNIHHPRTRMPVTYLKSQEASDIASWLLERSQEVKDYQEKDKKNDPIAPDNDTLVEMARLYLSKAPGMTAAEVNKYLPKSKTKDELPPGITDEERQKLIPRDADEQVLLAEKDKSVAREKLLWYIGKKSISRLGCYGCHDVPGFESAKPIGTALNDWGKKDPERLAFEDSESFVTSHYNIVENRDDVKNKASADPKWKSRVEEMDGKKHTLEPYEKYFADGIEHHSRQGFLHLKLAEPRSFDYKRIRSWDDRLRMPQFQFSRPKSQKTGLAFGLAVGIRPEEANPVLKKQHEERKDALARDEAEAREAVMTFVLGLTADPIPLKYVSNPPPDRAAEVRGRQVLEKYNCAGCHQLRPGVYEFKPTKDAIDRLDKAYVPVFPEDHVFPNHNAWVGNPSPYPDRMVISGVYPESREVKREDNPDRKDRVIGVRLTDALRYTNNQKVVRDIPASSKITVAEQDLLSRADPWGGRFVTLMVGPTDPENEKKYTGPVSKQSEGDADKARSKLPPPLIREGERVQTKWLYQFLLNPTPIRPEDYMKLRMPRFNMSPEESQAIVNYFAAAAKTNNPSMGLAYPYETVPQRDKRYWAVRSQEYIKANDNPAAAEARVRAELKESEAILVELNKADKKDDKAIKDMEGQIKNLKEEIDKKNWDGVRKRWLTPDVYERDAYKLLTNRSLCIQCHSIGDNKRENVAGPPLDLSAERLRPEWTQEWVSNPVRLFPYNPLMPQNFGNDRKDEKTGISIQWLDSFYGTPRDQARATRDALMDLGEVQRTAGKK